MPTGAPNISQIFLVSALLMMILVGFIIFFVLVYQKRLIRQQMHLQALEAQHQRKLLAASIDTQEKERRRIARDLHDEIGATLSTLKLQIGQFKRQMKEEPRAVAFCEKSQQILTETIQQVRQISHDLLPPLLVRFGLSAALKGLLDRIDADGELQTSFQIAGKELRLPTNQELALYRVVQELLQNTFKHAEAHQIKIQLTFLDEKLQLLYADDGKGFELLTLRQQGGGLGLDNIESRLLAINGTLQYHTTPGEGIRVEINLPLRSTATSQEPVLSV